MAAERRQLTLGKVCSKIGSGATPRGGKEAYLGGATALIRSQNIYNDRFVHNGLAFIDDAQAGELRNVTVEQGDVLLNITGDSVARCCQVDPTALPARVNQHVAIIRPHEDALDASFLRYSLVSPSMQAQLLALASSGATRNALTKAMIENLVIDAPPILEQRAIASILGTLDDKIEANRRTNETLEAMTRALFKSWFVDFDPVRAKAEGRPLHLDEATAALFPGALQDSDLGELPEGWAPVPLYELATYINGAAYRAFEPNAERRGLPIIKIAELKAGVTEQTKFSDVQMPAQYRLDTGDILFSWSGNPDTSIDTFIWSHGAAWLNQHIFRVVPHREVERSFVLATLKYLRPVFAEIARNKQTTGLGHVTAGDMKRLLVVRPDDRVLSAWDKQAAPLFARLLSNALEAQALTAVRDALLPRLLSGELELGDADRFLSAEAS
jgi:type I restriction enzyme S subunit